MRRDWIWLVLNTTGEMPIVLLLLRRRNVLNLSERVLVWRLVDILVKTDSSCEGDCFFFFW